MNISLTRDAHLVRIETTPQDVAVAELVKAVRRLHELGFAPTVSVDHTITRIDIQEIKS